MLLRIGQDVLDGFESDETSRADWRLREKLGMRLLGISENLTSPRLSRGVNSGFPWTDRGDHPVPGPRHGGVVATGRASQRRYPKACNSVQTLSDKPSGWRNTSTG